MHRFYGCIRVGLIVTFTLILASCGGGGGSSSTTQPTATATMKAGTLAVGSTEVGTSVTVTSDSTGQTVLTVQNANSKLTNAQPGQVIVFEASSAMPLGFAGVVQSVQTTSASGVPSTTVTFVPAGIGDVFQNLNLNMSNVATNPQLIAGVALQNGVRAYTKTEPQVASGVLGTIQNGLIELNVLANNTGIAVGVDFSSGIHATFWKVNGNWVNTDPSDPLAPKVDIVFTGAVELQNPNFSQANFVIENSKLVTHNLQLQGTLKRNIKASVTGSSFNVTASDLAALFSGATSSYNENNGYNEYSFDYKGSSIKVHGVEKDPAKIILGAAIISAAGVVPTYGTNATGDVLKTVPVGMVVTFFMTADMQVQATASLGYQWRDMDINAGMGLSYNDSLGLPVSLLTGNTKPIVPFWNATAHLDQPEGVSYDASGSASATLTAGVDGGIVLAGLEISQAGVEGGIRGSFSGQFSKPVGGTIGGCVSNASVTAGVRALLDVAADVTLKTDFKSKWLKWLNTSVSTGYVYEFPMYPAGDVYWLAENTIWSVGSDTCHNPLFSATAGTTLYSYSFDASATGYQPMVTSYTWDFGDGATATSVTAAHTYSTSGTYTATLTVLFSDGIQKTVSQTITVAAVPALSPAFTVNFNGLQASFDASTSTPTADITTYDWSFGDGTTASGVTASHIYATYSGSPWPVTLTVTDSYGRIVSTSQNVSATCPVGQVLQNGQCVTPTLGTIFSRPNTGESIPLGAVTNFYQYYFMGYASLANPPSSPNYWVSTQGFDKVRVKKVSGTATCADIGFSAGLTNENGNLVASFTNGTAVGNYCDFQLLYYYSTQAGTVGAVPQGTHIAEIYFSGFNIGTYVLDGSSTNTGRSVNGWNSADTAGGFAFQFCSGSCDGTFSASSTLNDTGITSTQCYQAGSDVLVDCGSAGAIALNNAQDGMTGRDANPTTNSSTDGKLGFSFTSVTGGCVQDNVTGLMWEVKTTDGGLRDWNKIYTNYSATYDPVGQYGAATDASGFVTAVNATNLCSYSDWRLPTADELLSIVDYGVAYPGPTIDATWFPNTQGSEFWSASSAVGLSDNAWTVYFSDGRDGTNYRYGGKFVRLVRAGQSPISPRYTVSADGQEVTDNQTKLIWRRCVQGMNWDGSTCAGVAGTYTHEAALQLASVEASNNGKAWRLPNIKELSSITDKTLSSPAIDSTTFPATPTASMTGWLTLWFWSSTPITTYPTFAWVILHGSGNVMQDMNGRGNSANYMRLVRDGP